MRDLFIVIPGIMGSVLRRGDNELWNPGLGMATKVLRHREWARTLTLGVDDPADTEPQDGVIPTGLVESKTIVPGMVAIEGYSELHDVIAATFGRRLIEGDPLRPERRIDGESNDTYGHPNYFRFAYDWRRDVRSSALRLHDLIETALPALRKDEPDARVVIIAHSMGGLVARYYMYGTDPRNGQLFDGWRNVRELLAIGTPFRGSPSALDHLHQGFRKLFVDFSAALRSYTSVYQLLPRYPMVERPASATGSCDGGVGVDAYLYPHEIQVDGLDPVRAKIAYEEFHRVMDAGIESAGTDHRIRIVPNIGYGHTTVNSARLTADGVETDAALPAYLNAAYRGGDGTVPIVSAIPWELDDDRSALRYINQQHGSLQVDHRTLSAEIVQRLLQAQTNTQDARAGSGVGDVAEMAALGLSAPQYALSGHAESVVCDLIGIDTEPMVMVRIADLSTGQQVGPTSEIEPGGSVALPQAKGDYLIDAYCPSASLESRRLFAVVDPDG